MSTDLTLLRSFLAVARHGAVTDAARALGVTQPALSRRIHQLEHELGAPLFARSRKGVELTDIGRVVAGEARAVIDRYDRMRHGVGAHLGLEIGTVRIGAGATAVSAVLPDAIARFRRDHPGIRFEVVEAGSRAVEDAVAREHLELGIVTAPARPRDELESAPLVRDDIVLVASRHHALGARRTIAASVLDGAELIGFEAGSAIRQLIDGALRAAGVTVDVVMELRSIPGILRMVAATGGLAFVSRMAVSAREGELRVIAVRGLQIRRQLSVVTRRGRPLSPAAGAFAATLRQSVR